MCDFTEDEAKEVFNVFDADGSGQICCKELENVLGKLMKNSTPAECKDLCEAVIKEADKNKDGTISWSEFKKFVLDK